LTTFTVAHLNRIIERDATDTTYKYALLRATSNIVNNHPPTRREEGKVWYPTGFLVEKWVEYYYPIIEHQTFIPQKGGEKEHGKTKRLAFRNLFKQLTIHYKPNGGFKAFWRDYKRGSLPPEANRIALSLAKKLWYTLTRYPMKHLGYSVTGKHYSYYSYTNRRRIPTDTSFNQETLLKSFGMFSLKASFYEALKTFGYYVSGEYSVLNKWIEFTVKADPTRRVTPQLVYKLLNTSPIEERDVHDPQQFFKDLMEARGVWSARGQVESSGAQRRWPSTMWFLSRCGEITICGTFYPPTHG